LSVSPEVPRTEQVLVIATAEVDHATAQDFEAEILPLLDPAANRVVIDLSAVTFLGSVGIRTIVEAGERVPELRVRNPQPIVRRVLEITGLGDLVVT
jgi:anti-anti-sigma factor